MSTLAVNTITDEPGTGAVEFPLMPTVNSNAIIERGSNANGSFTKYADGTMICTVEITESRSVTGILATSVTLPAAYISATDYILIGNSRTSVPDVVSTLGFIRATVSTATMYIARSTTTNTAVSICAVGRWY
jgi:hypothetical protein